MFPRRLLSSSSLSPATPSLPLMATCWSQAPGSARLPGELTPHTCPSFLLLLLLVTLSPRQLLPLASSVSPHPALTSGPPALHSASFSEATCILVKTVSHAAQCTDPSLGNERMTRGNSVPRSFPAREAVGLCHTRSPGGSRRPTSQGWRLPISW